MSKKLTTEQFIEKSIQIHGNKYDYSKVNYINSYTKVCIICPEHGEFWQLSDSHLRGCGDFKKICGSAYNVSRKNGWLNEMTWLSSKRKN